MTIRHFQIFTAVVDCRTMHQAAKELYLSQPNISQAIGELERHYQVKLFERYKKKLILTPEGERLLKHCRALLAQYDALNQDMRKLQENPVLRIGATVSVGEEILVPLVAEFESKYPHIRIEVTVNNTEYVEEYILNGKLDAGIVEGQTVSSELERKPFCQDCMQVVVAPDNPLVKFEQISPQDLADYGIITREQGSQVRNVLLNMLAAQGIPVQIKWNCTNIHTIKQAVMAGQGISVLSSLVTQKEIAEGSLKVLSVEGLDGHRQIHLALHHNKNRSEALNCFLRFCETYSERLQTGWQTETAEKSCRSD
ncbi:MAG: LysR family transcriptional regulator [Eubacteriales bacterium]|nr:LysR family transcriptional regulator [Eubacteriales bacterium]